MMRKKNCILKNLDTKECPEKIGINFIHPREVISRKEYIAQMLGKSEFYPNYRTHTLVLYSFGDAFQILP